MPHAPKPTAVLLIDGDNIPLDSARAIVDFCGRHTDLKIKNAYGDWTKSNLSRHRELLSKMGVTPVQQDRLSENATDFGMSMHAVELLQHGATDIVFVVTHDGDFSALCQRLRTKGMRVIGVGGKGRASQSLVNACDSYCDLDAIVQNPAMPFKMPSANSVMLNINPNGVKGQAKKNTSQTAPQAHTNGDVPKTVDLQKAAQAAAKRADTAQDVLQKAKQKAETEQETALRALEQLTVAREEAQTAVQNAADAHVAIQAFARRVTGAQIALNKAKQNVTAAENALRSAEQKAVDAQKVAEKAAKQIDAKQKIAQINIDKAATAKKAAQQAEQAAIEAQRAASAAQKAADAHKTATQALNGTQSNLRRDLLVKAHSESNPQNGWVDLPTLGTVLRQIDNEYQQRFGSKKLSMILKEFPDHFEVKDNRVRRRKMV